MYGFDAEWCRGETGVRIFGISFPGERVKLFDLNAAGIYGEESFPDCLKQLLEKKHLIPAGVNVGGDCTRMLNFGVRINKYYELMGMAKTLNTALKSYGMQFLVREFLKAEINKDGQNGDYSQVPLPDDLKKYTAIDVAVSRVLYQTFRKLLSNLDVEVVLDPPPNIEEQDSYDLVLGGEGVAKVKIVFLASRNAKDGLVLKWGSKKVEADCAIVEVQQVIFPNVHPPYTYTAQKNDRNDASWDKKNMTIQKLFDDQVQFKVKTSSLLKDVLLDKTLEEDGPIMEDQILKSTTQSTSTFF